ncbi:hypothetical protein [Actinocorallia aurea]
MRLITRARWAAPLLWPADEPWPVCATEHHDAYRITPLAETHLRCGILTKVWARPRRPRRTC